MLLEEWLLAAEYVMAQGNPDVILCERGIRTFETATRNTLDVAPSRSSRALPPADLRRPQPRRRQARLRPRPLPGRRRRRRRRPDDRGPPEPRPRPLRRRPIAHLRRVRRADAAHRRRRGGGRSLLAFRCGFGPRPRIVVVPGHAGPGIKPTQPGRDATKDAQSCILQAPRLLGRFTRRYVLRRAYGAVP